MAKLSISLGAQESPEDEEVIRRRRTSLASRRKRSVLGQQRDSAEISRGQASSALTQQDADKALIDEAVSKRAIKSIEDDLKGRNTASLGRGPASVPHQEGGGSVHPEIEKAAQVQRMELSSQVMQANPDESIALVEAASGIPRHVKKDIKDKLRKGENILENTAPDSVTGKFAEGIAAFLPTIIGAAFGGIEGAAKGSIITKNLLAAEKAQQELDGGGVQKVFSPDTSLVDSRTGERVFPTKTGGFIKEDASGKQVKVAASNVTQVASASTKANIQVKRDAFIITAKENFSKRADIKASKEQIGMLNSLEDILTDAPSLAAGTVGFKIAKGIAGEVGNLTAAEREDAQISPSFWRNIKRDVTKFLSGNIPEEDMIELKKITKALRKKLKGRLSKKAGQFSKSRFKRLGLSQEEFTNELISESILEEEAETKSELSTEEQSDLERLRKKFNR